MITTQKLMERIRSSGTIRDAHAVAEKKALVSTSPRKGEEGGMLANNLCDRSSN
jgi:hypothetical protein